MIQVPALPARSRATGGTERARNRDQINKRAASTQLHQSEPILAPLNRAPDHSTVEIDHLLQVCDAKYQMIDLANLDHGTNPGTAA
jgi:hypothetical protein